ncbi:MAG: L-lactate dehydrogenase [Clostridia bacterium]|nr:L-lactate dehydrogenase [Clostridia bacterium]
MKNKVVIVGAGNVGTSLAFKLIDTNSCVNEIIFIDINNSKVQWECMDLNHCLPYVNKKITIKSGSYDDCKDANIVVLTADAGENIIKSRLEVAQINTNLVKEIVTNVVKTGFNGIFVVATNPVDIITYVVNKVSGFPRNKIIGTGTLLDTVRFKYLLADKLNVPYDAIDVMVLGEHGDSSFPVISNGKIKNENMASYFFKHHISLQEIDTLYEDVRKAGIQVASLKGNTSFAISMSILKIIQTISKDEKMVLPLSVFLQNEYGENNICVSVPCTLNALGAEVVKDMKLNTKEQEAFSYSTKTITNVLISKINPMLKK